MNQQSGGKDGEQTESGIDLTNLFSKVDRYLYERTEESSKPSTYDIPNLERRKEEKRSYYEDRSRSTWRDRLNYMWKVDEYGNYSPELQFVKEGTVTSFILGSGWGAWQESSKIHRIFLEQNKYTMFQHPREAQRALQDRIVLAMIQGGWRTGWRMGVLTFTMTSVCQSLTVVRNYINPLDYSVGGAAMGAVYKFNMGPRGMLSAGLGGAILGLGAGAIIWSAQALSGETVADRWHREFSNMEEKKRIKEQILANKDMRKDIIEEGDTTVKQANIQLEDDSPYTREKEDYLRNIVTKLSQWFDKLGITHRSGGDNFRIVQEDSSDSKGV